MKAMNSAKYAVCLTAILPLYDDHFKNRSDEWWDRFWCEFGKEKARGIRDKEQV